MIPPRAGRRQIDLGGPGDGGDCIACLRHGVGVSVEVEVTLGLVRVAPRDREHLLTLRDVMFDHAPAGREIEDVVLVDRRRDEQEGDFSYLHGRGLVMDELEHLGAQYDRPGRDRQVAAHLELAGVNRGRQPRRPREVVDQAPGAPHEVAPAGVDRLLEHRGVRPGEVGWGEGVEHVPSRQSGPPLGSPVDPRVRDQPVDGLTDCQVALEQPPEQPVVLPGRVGEAPVASRRRELGAPGDGPR
jgi:hypothetical protein